MPVTDLGNGRFRRPITALVAVTVLGAAALVFAQGLSVSRRAVTEGYQPQKTAPTAYRSALDTADIANLNGATANAGGVVDANRTAGTDNSIPIACITTFTCGGYPNIRVSGRFTSSGATAPLRVVRCHYDGTATTPALTVIDTVEQTLTASDFSTDADSAYYSVRGLTFDTAGCPVIKVLIDSGGVSAGSLTLYVEGY